MEGSHHAGPDGEPWDDVVEVGSSRRPIRLPGRLGRVPPGWLLLGLVALVVAVGVVTTDSERAPSESSTSAPSPSAPPSTAATPADDAQSSGSPALGPPVVEEVGRRLLGVTGDWELFARGAEEVVRIELARGRITTTALPELSSGGPVGFLVGPERALVSPLDAVPGYLVPNGEAAREVPAALRRGGPVLPGPDPGQVWVGGESGGGESRFLVTLDGRELGVSVPTPWQGFSPAGSDGRGYLLVSGPGGVYQSRPDGLHRVTTGEVLAVGPNHWLNLECDDRARCSSVLVDRTSGARRVVDRSGAEPSVPRGVVSPDGSTAALLHGGVAGHTTLHLLDLASGEDRALDVDVAEHGWFGSAGIAWSPDGQWLFVPSADGELLVVEAATGGVREFGVTLPEVSQVAVRGSPR